jgi:hypothetical protein
MVAHVLFDRAVAVVTADDRIGQVEIFDDGFELAAMPCGDLAAEDGGELRGLADRAVGVEETLAERIARRTALKDQVVAVFDLCEKQPMLTGRLAPFGRREEGREGAEPLLRTPREVTRGQGIGQDLQRIGSRQVTNALPHCRKEMPSACR